MKGEDFKPAIAAVWKILHVGENLVYQIAIVPNILAVGH
jgi:hypothetical protein